MVINFTTIMVQKTFLTENNFQQSLQYVDEIWCLVKYKRK